MSQSQARRVMVILSEEGTPVTHYLGKAAVNVASSFPPLILTQSLDF